jgi:hypothetical protein
VKNTLLSTAAGILDLVGGTLGIICGHLADSLDYPDTTTASILFCAALLAIGGGIFSLKRGMWGLALVGSISAFLLFGFLVPALLLVWESPLNITHFTARVLLFIGVFLGMASLAFTVVSRKEFS